MIETQYIKKTHEEIDHSSNRLISDEHLHLHPYDPELLESIRDDILKPRTCKEFMDWLETHPHYDMVAEASSQFLRGTHQDDCFYKCAKINTDWNFINTKIDHYAKENLINEKFDTNYTKEWRANEMKKQKDFVPFRHNTELDNMRKHGFTKQYQLIEVTLTEMFPELKEIEKLFEFVWGKADINYQPTSGQFPRHVDFLTTPFRRAIETDSKLANTKYNPYTKTPEGYSMTRILIALDDWVPGQMFMFENHSWNNWTAGDTINFAWHSCRHSTSNCSYRPRPLMKISGMVRDDHWLAKNEFKEFTL